MPTFADRSYLPPLPKPAAFDNEEPAAAAASPTAEAASEITPPLLLGACPEDVAAAADSSSGSLASSLRVVSGSAAFAAAASIPWLSGSSSPLVLLANLRCRGRKADRWAARGDVDEMRREVSVRLVVLVDRDFEGLDDRARTAARRRANLRGEEEG